MKLSRIFSKKIEIGCVWGLGHPKLESVVRGRRRLWRRRSARASRLWQRPHNTPAFYKTTL